MLFYSPSPAISPFAPPCFKTAGHGAAFGGIGQPDGLGKLVDVPAIETSQQAAPLKKPTATVMDAGSDTASIFEMGRR